MQTSYFIFEISDSRYGPDELGRFLKQAFPAQGETLGKIRVRNLRRVIRSPAGLHRLVRETLNGEE